MYLFLTCNTSFLLQPFMFMQISHKFFCCILRILSSFWMLYLHRMFFFFCWLQRFLFYLNCGILFPFLLLMLILTFAAECDFQVFVLFYLVIKFDPYVKKHSNFKYNKTNRTRKSKNIAPYYFRFRFHKRCVLDK